MLANLRVQCGEEPPDHGEDISGVGHGHSRQLAGVADVQLLISAGQAAQVGQHLGPAIQVVVDPHDPAGVVGGHQLKVGPDAFEVAAGFHPNHVTSQVEAEGVDLLAFAPAFGKLQIG